MTPAAADRGGWAGHRARSGRAAGALVAAIALLLSAAVAPAAAQESAAPPRIRLSGWGGFSLREGAGSFGVGDDLRTFGLRLTLGRRGVLQPWAGAARFRRPGFECVPGFPCIADGWLVRAGVVVPLSEDERTARLHPYFTVGLGAGFGEDTPTRFAYLGGIGLHWTVLPRVGPSFEVRQERVPGLRSVFTLNAGLRVGLF